MGTLISQLLGFHFRRHIKWRVELSAVGMIFSVDVSWLVSEAAVLTYADVFVSSQLVVGKDQPKELFCGLFVFYKKKKGKLIGWDESKIVT